MFSYIKMYCMFVFRYRELWFVPNKQFKNNKLQSYETFGLNLRVIF